jgi:hypothetical protein
VNEGKTVANLINCARVMGNNKNIAACISKVMEFRCSATTLIVALSPVHSDITRFLSLSPIATENHLDRAKLKKFQKLLSRLTGTADVSHPLSDNSVTHFEESYCM